MRKSQCEITAYGFTMMLLATALLAWSRLLQRKCSVSKKKYKQLIINAEKYEAGSVCSPLQVRQLTENIKNNDC